jgi:ElaB/YqjD/DUF883 family membrane-anchored ribosome-binding protein
MADNLALATLKDSKNNIEKLLTKSKNNIDKFLNLDRSEQETVSNQINLDFRSIKNELESMISSVGSLSNEQSQKAFKDQISLLKQEYKKLNDEFQTKLNEKRNQGALLMEDINLRPKNINELTAQEAIDRMDNVLDQDDKALKRMINTVDQDVKIAQQVKSELDNQKEKLDKTDKNLKEIDYSLNRAAKQISTMFKMYACDKLIMCMIFVIVGVIVGIIIAAAVGGLPEGKFNVPNDIFGLNKNTTTKSS